MVYNEKYNRWCDTTGKIYRQTKDGKFIECKQSIRNGYLRVYCGRLISSHRLIWETFNYEIPEGYEIDHINTIRDDNRIDNLRCVTRLENMNNPLTLKKRREKNGGNYNTNYDFGKKYFEYYGYSKTENINQYDKERMWYRRHNNTCRWEVK